MYYLIPGCVLEANEQGPADDLDKLSSPFALHYHSPSYQVSLKRFQHQTLTNPKASQSFPKKSLPVHQHIPISLPLKLTWVSHEEDDSDEEHQQAVKNIQRPLMRQRVPIRTQKVFDNSEDGAHHDQSTDCVKHVQALLPWDIHIVELWCWVMLESFLKVDLALRSLE